MAHTPEPEQILPNYPEKEEVQERFTLNASENVVFVGEFIVTSEHYYKMLNQFHSTISQHFNVLPLLINWVTNAATGQTDCSIEIW